MKIYIYTLNDPRTNKPRYVGKTNNTTVRLKSHLKEEGRSKKVSWIKNLSGLGLEPTLEVLEVCNKDTWSDTERYWVSQLRDWGFDLTNHHQGGHYCGVGIGHSESTKEKIGRASKEAWKRGCYKDVNMSKAREASLKARISKMVPVEMYKDNELVRVFSSILEAGREMGFNVNRMREVIKGYKDKGNGRIDKVNSYKGYVFKYKS
jgi:hypothetical protein